MTDPLLVVATLVAKNGAEAQLRDALVPAIPRFRAEPGCQGYVLLEDRDRPGRFVTYETWADQNALDAHMSSPTMAELGPVMGELLADELTQDFLTVVVSA